jgi:hypothetical protein
MRLVGWFCLCRLVQAEQQAVARVVASVVGLLGQVMQGGRELLRVFG